MFSAQGLERGIFSKTRTDRICNEKICVVLLTLSIKCTYFPFSVFKPWANSIHFRNNQTVTIVLFFDLSFKSNQTFFLKKIVTPNTKKN